MRKPRLFGLASPSMLGHWTSHFNLSYLDVIGNIYVYRILKDIVRVINISERFFKILNKKLYETILFLSLIIECYIKVSKLDYQMTLNHSHLTNIRIYPTSVSPFSFFRFNVEEKHTVILFNTLSRYATCVPYGDLSIFYIHKVPVRKGKIGIILQTA